MPGLMQCQMQQQLRYQVLAVRQSMEFQCTQFVLED
jgi:hypothetical protein